MLRHDILLFGRIFLICSLANCRHLSSGVEEGLATWRAASGRAQGSPRQQILRDQDPEYDQQISEDQSPQIPSRFGDEDGLVDDSQRHSEQNAMNLKGFRALIEHMKEERLQGSRGDQLEQSLEEDRGSSRSQFHARHQQEGSRHKHEHGIDQIPDSPELQRDDEGPTFGAEALKETDPIEGGFRKSQMAAVRDERASEDGEKESNEAPSAESEGQVSRYEGYEEYEGVGIYKFHLEGADGFDEANEICKKEGGHLAIANSKDEADVFVTLWMRHGPMEESDAYVGIHNRNPQDVFRTVLGNTLASTGYFAWRAGEPNNKNGVEHCVSFFRYGGYRDIPCNGPRPFICELRWKNEH